MTAYHLYFLDSRDRVFRRVDLECRDDEHAIEIGTAHIHEHGMELWHAERMVKRFEPRTLN